MTDKADKAEPQAAVQVHRSEGGEDSAGGGKRASIRFVVVFVLLVAVFYVPYAFISQTEGYRSTYLSLIAKSTSGVLCVLGQDTTATGPFIRSPSRPPQFAASNRSATPAKPRKGPLGRKAKPLSKRDATSGGKEASRRSLSFEIIPGCDGTEGFALFGSAVLASPFLLRARVFFLMIGSIVLFVVNTLRLVTLFMLGLYWPDVFHSAHMDLWPGFIIVAVMVCWLSWARWMMRRPPGVPREWG